MIFTIKKSEYSGFLTIKKSEYGVLLTIKKAINQSEYGVLSTIKKAIKKSELKRLYETHNIAVSYTHLTLPTKRIV